MAGWLGSFAPSVACGKRLERRASSPNYPFLVNQLCCVIIMMYT
jgi:hypothetical protein